VGCGGVRTRRARGLVREPGKGWRFVEARASRLKRQGSSVLSRSTFTGLGGMEQANEPHEEDQRHLREYTVQYHDKPLPTGGAMSLS
jgi:hypothetical protein